MVKRVSETQPVYFSRENEEGPWRAVRFMQHDDGTFFAVTAALSPIVDDEKAFAPPDIIFTPASDPSQAQWDVYDAQGHCFRFIIEPDKHSLVCCEKIEKKIYNQIIPDIIKTTWQGRNAPVFSPTTRDEKKAADDLATALGYAPFNTASDIVRRVEAEDRAAAEKAAKAARWAVFCRNNAAFPEDKEEDNFPERLSDELSRLLNEALGTPGSYETPEDALFVLSMLSQHYAGSERLDAGHRFLTSCEALNTKLAITYDNEDFLQHCVPSVTDNLGSETCRLIKNQHVHALIRRKMNFICENVMCSEPEHPLVTRADMLLQNRMPQQWINSNTDKNTVCSWIRQELPEKFQGEFFAEFRKIYNALYEGQSGFFKSGRHHHENIESVFAYAQKAPDSRTAKALELTARYFDQKSPDQRTNPKLFQDVYEYAFKNGSWFSISNASGHKFRNFFSKPLQENIRRIRPPGNDDLNDPQNNTRSVKIGRALRG